MVKKEFGGGCEETGTSGTSGAGHRLYPAATHGLQRLPEFVGEDSRWAGRPFDQPPRLWTGGGNRSRAMGGADPRAPRGRFSSRRQLPPGFGDDEPAHTRDRWIHYWPLRLAALADQLAPNQ